MLDCRKMQSLCDDVARELEAAQRCETVVGMSTSLANAERSAIALYRSIMFNRAAIEHDNKEKPC